MTYVRICEEEKKIVCWRYNEINTWRNREILIKSEKLFQVQGLINFFCCISYIRNNKQKTNRKKRNVLQYDVYILYLVLTYMDKQRKYSLVYFNISAFYFYFALLQMPDVWGTMKKCSPYSLYCWFLYGSKFSLSQIGNPHVFHGPSDRIYTILFNPFCCFSLYVFLFYFWFWDGIATITCSFLFIA